MNTSEIPFALNTINNSWVRENGYVHFWNTPNISDRYLLREEKESMESYIERLKYILNSKEVQQDYDEKIRLTRLIKEVKQVQTSGFEVMMSIPAYTEEGRPLYNHAAWFLRIPEENILRMRSVDIKDFRNKYQRVSHLVEVSPRVEARLEIDRILED